MRLVLANLCKIIKKHESPDNKSDGSTHTKCLILFKQTRDDIHDLNQCEALAESDCK